MSIRIKVVLSLLVTAIALISVMHFVTRKTFDPRFANLEMTRVPRVATQVSDALTDRSRQLAGQMRDWSHWNDAEAFLKGEMPDFARQSFPPSVLDEMGVSLLIYCDLEGRSQLTVVATGFAAETEEIESLAAELRKGGRLQPARTAALSGLISVNAALFEFAAGPVTGADGKHPSSGICLFARKVDAAEVSVLQSVCKHQVHIIGLGSDESKNLLKECLQTKAGVYAHADAEDQLSAYAPLFDAWGAPAALSRSVIDRELYTEGRQTVLLVTTELVATGVLLAVLTFLLFETLVLSRITDFSTQVNRLAKTADFSSRVVLKGTDEMANLAQPVNALLCSLQKAQADLASQQKQLVTSERRLSTALAATGDGLWDWSSATGVYLSPGSFAMIGKPAQDRLFAASELLALLFDEDQSKVAAAMEPVLAGSSDHLKVDIKLSVGNDQIKWVQVRGQVIDRDYRNRPTRIVGLSQDITERRHAETEILESRELFRNAFEESASGMAMVSTTGAFLRVNPVFCDIVGYTREELAEKTFQDITYPPDLALDEAYVMAMLRGERRHYTMEKRYLTKNGAIVWVLLNVGIVVDADLKPLYFISQVQDITQLKRGQQELHAYANRLLVTKDQLERRSAELADKTIEAELAKRAAEEANDAKSDFLAHMSHELRTPMTGILGFADLLRQPDVSDAERKEFANTIMRHGQHLLALMDDSLDISKIEAGKMTLELLDCDPIHIAADVESLLSVRARRKGLSIKVSSAPDVPRKIRTDPTRLRQILINVVGNAVKFSSSGSISIDIAYLNANSDSPRVRYVVTDTGIGMTPEQIDRVFEPFEQAEVSTTRRYGGTGLGLSIAKRLVELLDGNITVHSEAGIGTQFSITLGVGRRGGQKKPESQSTQVSPPTVDANSLAGRRVLIADDGQDNQYLLGYYLNRSGATFETVSNGQEAVEVMAAAVARGEPFDMVLMDIQMPVMDGLSATQALRTAGHTLPIVALTAHGTSAARADSAAAGCNDHLVKPIEFAALIASVAKWTAAAAAKAPLQSAWRDAEGFGPILQGYISELPQHVSKLRELIENQDLAAVGALAHQIKGSGGGYGFADLSTVAARVEEGIEQKHLDSVVENVDKLIDTLRSIEGYDPELEATYAAARARN